MITNVAPTMEIPEEDHTVENIDDDDEDWLTQDIVPTNGVCAQFNT